MMSKSAQLAALLAICTICAATASTAATAETIAFQGGRSIDVVGLDGKKTTVSLAVLERKSVTTADAAGIKTTHEGVLVRDVLVKAGVAMGDALRGKALARVVIATAADGYQVAYAIAELDPGFTDNVVLIADTRNGQPLIADSGPLQIVVPHDKRAARWVRQVTTLEVRQLP